MTVETLIVLALQAITVYFLVSEVVRVNVAAICVMVLLGLIAIVPGIGPPIDTNKLFVGYSSNAVISIIADIAQLSGYNDIFTLMLLQLLRGQWIEPFFQDSYLPLYGAYIV